MKVFPPSHKQSPVTNEPTHTDNSTVSSKKQGETDQPNDTMAASDFRDHLEGLRSISSVATRLFTVLVQQLTTVSYAIPIQKGFEIVANLKARAESQREDLKISFDIVQKEIEESKAGFWTKHGETLKAGLQKYVQKKIEERTKAEIDRKLEKYVAYLNDHDAKKKGINAVFAISHARLQNSLLRLQYLSEPVTWIGDLPEGLDQGITFGQLISADATSALNLAKTLGLSPTPEDDRLSMLNRVMQHLGIGYKGIPSHTGILLMPIKTTP